MRQDALDDAVVGEDVEHASLGHFAGFSVEASGPPVRMHAPGLGFVLFILERRRHHAVAKGRGGREHPVVRHEMHPRGLGTRAARRAMKSRGSSTTAVEPSRYFFFSL